MNKFEKAREAVVKAYRKDGVTVTLERSNKSRDEVTGAISDGTPTTHQATGFFKPINSLSTDKNIALRGDFKSTDSVFSTVGLLARLLPNNGNGSSFELATIIGFS